MGTVTVTLRRTLAIAALVALAFGFAGFGAFAPTALGQAPPAPAPVAWAVAQSGVDEPELVAAADAELFARTELFFGTSKPDGTVVSDEEWGRFLDQEITPRFPDGLTVLTGYGQFRNAAGTIIRERSFVLILLYPSETRRNAGAKIEQIRTAYKARFQQESVLRVDDVLPARTSF